ncbi:predicted protein [Naegleria gruberi]|uniref:Predicted protein n=1 Tax=Naegleria gruberi TaxID=5762 RepID=D2VG71_NAEGR|nr:uncharacterized protein NAEGRDRAFT_67874 [Naegleria gruberi]EFC44297.1 predicted protein [Naegleria gruberi]|eukprot:XP_002677041.1 predicted protein [Naegleria gruberi strain NEG-M]
MPIRPSASLGPFTANQILAKVNKLVLIFVPVFGIAYLFNHAKDTSASPLLADTSATPVDMKAVFSQWNSVRETLSPFWLDTPLRKKLSFDQVTEVDYLKEMEWKIVDGKVVFKK